MDFQYSYVLPPEVAPTCRLSGDLEVRRNRFGYHEESGCLRAQRDWKRYVGPIPFGFAGSRARQYGGINQILVPECRPQCLEIVSYAFELALLYDDAVEFFDQEEVNKANDNMQSAFKAAIDSAEQFNRNSVAHDPLEGLKRIQQQLFKELKDIDEPRAIVLLNSWNTFLEGHGRQHHQEEIYTSYEAYMDYRISDIGGGLASGFVLYGMGLTLPEEDMTTLETFEKPVGIALTLTNDVCSYAKEKQAAKRNGKADVCNAVELVMREFAVNVAEAEEICKQRITKEIDLFEKMLAEEKEHGNLSRDSIAYLEAQRYVMSGAAAWSLVCPRYGYGISR